MIKNDFKEFCEITISKFTNLSVSDQDREKASYQFDKITKENKYSMKKGEVEFDKYTDEFFKKIYRHTAVYSNSKEDSGEDTELIGLIKRIMWSFIGYYNSRLHNKSQEGMKDAIKTNMYLEDTNVLRERKGLDFFGCL